MDKYDICTKLHKTISMFGYGVIWYKSVKINIINAIKGQSEERWKLTVYFSTDCQINPLRSFP